VRTPDQFVSEEIDRLARQGATASELLRMLPKEALELAITAIFAEMGDRLGGSDMAQLRAVEHVLQIELDSRR
jgi:hypothetical protein